MTMHLGIMEKTVTILKRPVLSKPIEPFKNIPPGEGKIAAIMQRVQETSGVIIRPEEGIRLEAMFTAQHHMEELLKEKNPKFTNLDANGRMVFVKQSDEAILQNERYGLIVNPYSLEHIQRLLRPELLEKQPVMSLLTANYNSLLSSTARLTPEALLYSPVLRNAVRAVDQKEYQQLVEEIRQREWGTEFKKYERQWYQPSLWKKVFAGREEVVVDEFLHEGFATVPPSKQALTLLFLVNNDSVVDPYDDTIEYGDMRTIFDGKGCGYSTKEYLKTIFKDKIKRVLLDIGYADKLKELLNGAFDTSSLVDLPREQRRGLAAYCLVRQASGEIDTKFTLPDDVIRSVRMQATINQYPAESIESAYDLIAQRVFVNGTSEYQTLQSDNLVHAATFLDEALVKKGELTVWSFTQAHKILMDKIGGGGFWRLGSVQAGGSNREDLYVSSDNIHKQIRDLVTEANGIMQQAQQMTTEEKHAACAQFLTHYQSVHPPMDGAGRHGHVLVNAVMHKIGLPKFSVPRQQNAEYVNAIDQAIIGNWEKLRGGKPNYVPIIGMMKKYAVSSIPADQKLEEEKISNVKQSLDEISENVSSVQHNPEESSRPEKKAPWFRKIFKKI